MLTLRDQVRAGELTEWFRKGVPCGLTLLALGAGVFSIRLAVEGRFEIAITFVMLAAFLDAVDGFVARRLDAESRFGAELDSLADLVNFGVAPALLLYLWASGAGPLIGWWAVMAFVSCVALRLARFNVGLDATTDTPAGTRFFEGVPAPAGALLLLLPFYFQGATGAGLVYPPAAISLHFIVVALLMISRVPTFSSKQVHHLLARRSFGSAALLLMTCFVAGLFVWTWATLSFACFVYLASIPISWLVQRSSEQ